MVKYFASLNADQLEALINKYGKDNPNLEIVAISHANVVKTGFVGWFQWTAFVVYRNRA